MQTVLIFLIASICGVTSDDFSPQAQLNIVNTHNSLRSELALGEFSVRGVNKPSAKAMRKLSWSRKLATPAKEFAETCPKNHSIVGNQGESIYWHYSQNLNTPEEYGNSFPLQWWKEFEKNGWDSLTYDHAKHRFQIGHAVQMAWHSTYKVGCGYSKCDVGTPDQSMVVVCRYWKKGNIEGELIYEPGNPCSQCAPGYEACFDGLCGKSGVQVEDDD